MTYVILVISKILFRNTERKMCSVLFYTRNDNYYITCSIHFCLSRTSFHTPPEMENNIKKKKMFIHGEKYFAKCWRQFFCPGKSYFTFPMNSLFSRTVFGVRLRKHHVFSRYIWLFFFLFTDEVQWALKILAELKRTEDWGNCTTCWRRILRVLFMDYTLLITIVIR